MVLWRRGGGAKCGRCRPRYLSRCRPRLRKVAAQAPARRKSHLPPPSSPSLTLPHSFSRPHLLSLPSADCTASCLPSCMAALLKSFHAFVDQTRQPSHRTCPTAMDSVNITVRVMPPKAPLFTPALRLTSPLQAVEDPDHSFVVLTTAHESIQQVLDRANAHLEEDYLKKHGDHVRIDFDRVQNVLGADVRTTFNVGDLFSVHTPTSERVLHIQRTAFGRQDSIAPGSALRPQVLGKRKAQGGREEEPEASRKRSKAEASVGASIDDVGDGVPLLSLETATEQPADKEGRSSAELPTPESQLQRPSQWVPTSAQRPRVEPDRSQVDPILEVESRQASQFEPTVDGIDDTQENEPLMSGASGRGLSPNRAVGTEPEPPHTGDDHHAHNAGARPARKSRKRPKLSGAAPAMKGTQPGNGPKNWSSEEDRLFIAGIREGLTSAQALKKYRINRTANGGRNRKRELLLKNPGVFTSSKLPRSALPPSLSVNPPSSSVNPPSSSVIQSSPPVIAVAERAASPEVIIRVPETQLQPPNGSQLSKGSGGQTILNFGSSFGSSSAKINQQPVRSPDLDSDVASHDPSDDWNVLLQQNGGVVAQSQADDTDNDNDSVHGRSDSDWQQQEHGAADELYNLTPKHKTTISPQDSTSATTPDTTGNGHAGSSTCLHNMLVGGIGDTAYTKLRLKFGRAYFEKTDDELWELAEPYACESYSQQCWFETFKDQRLWLAQDRKIQLSGLDVTRYRDANASIGSVNKTDAQLWDEVAREVKNPADREREFIARKHNQKHVNVFGLDSERNKRLTRIENKREYLRAVASGKKSPLRRNKREHPVVTTKHEYAEEEILRDDATVSTYPGVDEGEMGEGSGADGRPDDDEYALTPEEEDAMEESYANRFAEMPEVRIRSASSSPPPTLPQVWQAPKRARPAPTPAQMAIPPPPHPTSASKTPPTKQEGESAMPPPANPVSAGKDRSSVQGRGSSMPPPPLPSHSDSEQPSGQQRVSSTPPPSDSASHGEKRACKQPRKSAVPLPAASASSSKKERLELRQQMATPAPSHPASSSTNESVSKEGQKPRMPPPKVPASSDKRQRSHKPRDPSVTPSSDRSTSSMGEGKSKSARRRRNMREKKRRASAGSSVPTVGVASSMVDDE